MVGNVVFFSFSSGPQFNQGSREPLRPGVAFPTTSRLQLALELNCPPSVQFVGLILPLNSHAVIWTRLHASAISSDRDVSLPLSLEWPVWSSSSGNNRHAVQWSLSSGASVYESIIFLYLVPFHQPISAHAISTHKCHQNLSHPTGASSWMAFLARSKGQNITNVKLVADHN